MSNPGRRILLLGFAVCFCRAGVQNLSNVLYCCCCDMKLDHGCFGFSEESLKVEIFFSFFSSSCQEIQFYYFHGVDRVISGTRPSSPSFTEF